MILDPAEGVFVDFDEYETPPTAKQPASAATTAAMRAWSRLVARLAITNPGT